MNMYELFMLANRIYHNSNYNMQSTRTSSKTKNKKNLKKGKHSEKDMYNL